MIDGGLWKTLQPRLAPFGRMDRVENRVVKGMADVVYHLRGTTGWLELKHLDDWPKRPDTTLCISTLSKEQVLWQEGWGAAGAQVHTLLRVGKGGGALLLFLDPPMTRAMFERRFTRTSLVEALGLKMVRSYDVPAIIRILS